MEQTHRQILHRAGVDLMRNVSTEYGLLSELVSRGVINGQHQETLQAIPTEEKRVLKLLELLPRRGPDAFRIFCEALIKTDQAYIVEMYLQAESPTPVESKRQEISGTSTCSAAARPKVPRSSKKAWQEVDARPKIAITPREEEKGNSFKGTSATGDDPTRIVGLPGLHQKFDQLYRAIKTTPGTGTTPEVMISILSGHRGDEGGYLDAVYSTNLGTDDLMEEFQRQNPVPQSKHQAAAAAVPGRIILAGGVDNSGKTQMSVHSLNTDTMKWHREVDMNTERNCFTLTAVKRKGSMVVLAAGGSDGSRRLDSCEMLQSDGSRWSSVSKLIQAVSNHAASSVENKVYLTGGWTTQGSTNRTQCFNAMTGKWERCANMMQVRSGHCMNSVNLEIYVFGGRDAPTSLERYDPVRDQWTTINDMPSPGKLWATSITINNFVILLGGEDENIFLFDAAHKKWKKSSKTLPWKQLKFPSCSLVVPMD